MISLFSKRFTALLAIPTLFVQLLSPPAFANLPGREAPSAPPARAGYLVLSPEGEVLCGQKPAGAFNDLPACPSGLHAQAREGMQPVRVAGGPLIIAAGAALCLAGGVLAGAADVSERETGKKGWSYSTLAAIFGTSGMSGGIVVAGSVAPNLPAFFAGTSLVMLGCFAVAGAGYNLMIYKFMPARETR